MAVAAGACRVEVVPALAFGVVGAPVPVMRSWGHPGDVLAAVDLVVDVDDHLLPRGPADESMSTLRGRGDHGDNWLPIRIRSSVYDSINLRK